MTTPPPADADVLTTATDRPPYLDDQTLFGHPRGLAVLFMVEMWERFSYYGMRAILVLYLVHVLHWGDADADTLYGWYTSLVWLTPLLGGYLADRLIGTRRSLVIGGAVIAAGHFVLALDTMATFYIGLALVVVGTGFFKPNVSTMVGQLYRPGDARRDAGFTIFYMGINLGGFFAPLVCGWFAQSATMRTMLTGAGIDPARAWSFGFAAAGVGMLLGLALYVGLRDRYLPGIGVRGAGEATGAPPGTGEGTREGTREGTQPVRRDAALTHDEWQRIFGLLLMFVFVAFFWAVYEQAGSSLNLFADRYVDLHIAGRTLPSSWFQSAQPVFVIVLAPVFAELWRQLRKRRREPSTPLKMALGLAIIGVGCVFMIVAGRTVDACTHQGAASCAVTSPAWLTMFYLFSVLGELCVSPVGLSYVTKLAPARYVAFLMGAWFLTNATGSKLAGWLAALAPGLPQTEFFAILAAIGVAAATVLIFCVPWLKRLTQSAAG